jgi:hypothetical protein
MLRCGNFLFRGIYYSTAAALSRTAIIHHFAQRAHEVYYSGLKVTEGNTCPKHAGIASFCLEAARFSTLVMPASASIRSIYPKLGWMTLRLTCLTLGPDVELCYSLGSIRTVFQTRPSAYCRGVAQPG